MGRSFEFFDKCVDALFPRFCVRCKEEGKLLCDDCQVKWVPNMLGGICPSCHAVTLLGERCDFCESSDGPDGLVSSFSYADPPVRQLICAWKYDYDSTARDHLFAKLPGRLDPLREVLSAHDFDCVTSVPLHSQRLLERGFDQAGEIAQELAGLVDLPYAPLLARVRPTGQQAERTPEERVQAMAASPFVVSPSFEIPQSVIVVDDVWTTGATAAACSRALKMASVQQVWIYTLARGS